MARRSTGGKYSWRRGGRVVGDDRLGVTAGSRDARLAAAGREYTRGGVGRGVRVVLGIGNDDGDGLRAAAVQGGGVVIFTRGVHGNGHGRANREGGGQSRIGELHCDGRCGRCGRLESKK